MNQTVLIAFDQADALRDVLQARFPQLAFTAVTQPEDLPATLDEVRPQVVFSIKGPEFAAAEHRCIVLHPAVQWVQVGGSGYEHLWPWGTHLQVTNCAGVLSQALAETVIGATIALNGGLLRYMRQQQDHTWTPRTFRSLAEQTMLIVGLGSIGQRVADLAKSLGMRVLAIRRQQTPHPSVDVLAPPAELSTLLPQADVVSVHVRATDETRQLFDAARFARMKPGALFVNTARGSVVHEADLIAALQRGHLGGAYLDVFAAEPLPPSSPLWSMPNVLLTPHASDNVVDWPFKFTDFFSGNLSRWLAGEPLVNQITGTP